MRLLKLTLILTLICCSFYFVGCRSGVYGDYTNEALPGIGTISGSVTINTVPPVPGSIRAQVANGDPIVGARVWIEGRPDLFTITGPNGEYIIVDVPNGTFRVVARFKQGNKWYIDRSAAIVVDSNDTAKSGINLAAAEGTYRATGTLRDADGNLIRNIFLRLFGDDWDGEFRVDSDGRFITPPLPADWDIADLINDIFVPDYDFSFPISFLSSENPLDLDISVTRGGENQFPRVVLVALPAATTNNTPLGTIDPEQELRLKAYIFPRQPTSVAWSSEDAGTFSGETVLPSDDERFSVIQKTWKAPATGGIATLSVTVINEGKTARASLPIKVNAPIPTHNVIFNMNVAENDNYKGVGPADIVIAEGSSKALADGSAFLKYGQSFKSWNTQADGQGTTYQAGAQFQMNTADVTLYAQYENFAGGSGTLEDPYKIARADHLHEVRFYLDKHFIQVADIDLGASANYNTGWKTEWYDNVGGWMPIGNDYAMLLSDLEPISFRGRYNGDNKKISNLTINREAVMEVTSEDPQPSHAATFAGLFGYAYNAQLTNIKLENAQVKGNVVAGSLVAKLDGADSLVDNCSAEGTVANTSDIGPREVNLLVGTGGLIGYVSAGVISNSSFSGEVSAPETSAVGGLIGAAAHASENADAAIIDINNCQSSGTVTGVFGVGGLVGMAQYAKIDNCHSTSAVNGIERVGGLVGFMNEQETNSIPAGGLANSSAKGQVTGAAYVGGLVGDNAVSITSCSAEGNLTAKEMQIDSFSPQLKGPTYFGGLVGRNRAPVLNSWAKGQVTTSEGYGVGGLIGDNDGEISNCYAEGNVTGRYSTGGLIGESSDADITGCHSKGDVIGNYAAGGLIGEITLTTERLPELKSCYAEGSITCAKYAGGLVGKAEADIISCYAEGNVTVAESIEPADFVAIPENGFGGLVGLNNGNIRNSYATGNIEGSDFAGGFVGKHAKRLISNCYARGNVEGQTYVGGFAGGFEISSVIQSSYSSGTVTGNSGVGGFAGNAFVILVADYFPNCYYDTTLSGKNDEHKGYPRTTAQMKGQPTGETFNGWSTDIWNFYNDKYPDIDMSAEPQPIDS